MNFTGHILVGTAIGFVLTRDPVASSIVIFASLLPDIDHPKSLIGRYNPIVKKFKHRGRCHTLLGCLILSLPFLYISVFCYLLAFIGCLGHILADRLMSVFSGSRFVLKIW